MFERFTEQARQVVVLAQAEARGLGHDYIGTEHIVLGILREEGGIAGRVMASMDITAERVRDEVVRIVGSGTGSTGGQIPFTPRAKKVLELALREALNLGQNYIGTEHLLLGLVRENEGVAARILLDFGAGAERVRDEVIGVLSGPGAPVTAPPDVSAMPARAAAPELASEAEWPDVLSASLTAILERLDRIASGPGLIPRRRARRLVQDAILRHDFEAESRLGAEAWEAMVEEILDANPDVEPADP